MMPLYSTGISQPPKSTIRAPRARCTAFSGVLLRGAAGVTEAIRVAGPLTLSPPPEAVNEALSTVNATWGVPVLRVIRNVLLSQHGFIRGSPQRQQPAHDGRSCGERCASRIFLWDPGFCAFLWDFQRTALVLRPTQNGGRRANP